MAKNSPSLPYGKISDWVGSPTPGHAVAFYRNDSKIMSAAAGYFSSGLKCGDTCLIIATAEHISQLKILLAGQGIDADEAAASGGLIMADARQTLAKFMRGGLPVRRLFMAELDRHVPFRTLDDVRLRAYGEMVALLWQDGNKEAVLRLEELWNELGRRYSFSLLCGYPQLHFLMDNVSARDISSLHGCGELLSV